jgi:hypothetical protein
LSQASFSDEYSDPKLKRRECADWCEGAAWPEPVTLAKYGLKFVEGERGEVGGEAIGE